MATHQDYQMKTLNNVMRTLKTMAYVLMFQINRFLVNTKVSATIWRSLHFVNDLNPLRGTLHINAITIMSVRTDLYKALGRPTVDQFIAFEGGEMDDEQTIDFFGSLISTGMAWSLQGSYGRTAASLIDGGLIDRQGRVLSYGDY